MKILKTLRARALAFAAVTLLAQPTLALAQAASIPQLVTGAASVNEANSNIPIGLAPSGSIGNNGAVTLGTALPITYPNAYLCLPAGAIATGIPASGGGCYFTQMSSATVGTVYNNLYTPGTSPTTPSIPATPTAFVTTGPGAYTQVTGTSIIVWQYRHLTYYESLA